MKASGARVEDQHKAEKTIHLPAFKESINKAAYTDKHVGPKEDVGNKSGIFSNPQRPVPV